MSITEIRSPLPGTFFRKPAPDQPAYKSPGDKVEVDDVIGLIEVMKSFHELKSNAMGVLKRFLVENECPISPGQVVAEIEISGDLVGD